MAQGISLDKTNQLDSRNSYKTEQLLQNVKASRGWERSQPTHGTADRCPLPSRLAWRSIPRFPKAFWSQMMIEHISMWLYRAFNIIQAEGDAQGQVMTLILLALDLSEKSQ